MKPHILVITPIKDISGVYDSLQKAAGVGFLPDPRTEEVLSIIKDHEAIFTNPNKSRVFLSKSLIDSAVKLKAICTFINEFLRKIPQGWDSVKRGNWDCEPFKGRQLNHLKVGVVGYGRLGKLFSQYAHAFGANVMGV
jgi:D-3-phosphoglycerate dehydrogenase / 2-oxoglutarate reductase